MIQKLSKIFGGLGVVLALVLGTLFVSAAPAAAVVGHAYVKNYSITPVRAYCEYGKTTYKWLYKGQDSNDSGKCTAAYDYDVDQIQAATTLCMLYKGRYATDGWYRLDASERVKIADLSNTELHNYSSKCSSKPYYRVK